MAQKRASPFLRQDEPIGGRPSEIFALEWSPSRHRLEALAIGPAHAQCPPNQEKSPGGQQQKEVRRFWHGADDVDLTVGQRVDWYGIRQIVREARRRRSEECDRNSFRMRRRRDVEEHVSKPYCGARAQCDARANDTIKIAVPQVLAGVFHRSL